MIVQRALVQGRVAIAVYNVQLGVAEGRQSEKRVVREIIEEKMRGEKRETDNRAKDRHNTGDEVTHYYLLAKVVETTGMVAKGRWLLTPYTSPQTS